MICIIDIDLDYVILIACFPIIILATILSHQIYNREGSPLMSLQPCEWGLTVTFLEWHCLEDIISIKYIIGCGILISLIYESLILNLANLKSTPTSESTHILIQYSSFKAAQYKLLASFYIGLLSADQDRLKYQHISCLVICHA